MDRFCGVTRSSARVKFQNVIAFTKTRHNPCNVLHALPPTLHICHNSITAVQITQPQFYNLTFYGITTYITLDLPNDNNVIALYLLI